MGKALMGTFATPSTLALLDEVRALRERVAALETALAEAEEARRGRTVEHELADLDASATARR